MKKQVQIALSVFVAAGAVYGLLFWAREKMFSEENMYEQGTLVLMNQVRESLERYKKECGKYPAAISELTSPSCTSFKPDPNGRFTGVDRWGHAYEYIIEGETFTLRSMGGSWLETSPGQPAKVVKGMN